ncbi:MAG: polymerase sigma-70 factor, subfamily [Acidobacteriota bacterium]|jgi:RNA polymerase sigma-70 factor (ECF subfamily)|nr:polymerase sigma-70 factor, subfamily [Acidobacteriota bacterium]
MKLLTGDRQSDAADIPLFEDIFKLHHCRVYSLCLRMTGNAAEAEDLTQDVFIQVFRKIGSFRGDSAFTTWLHRLTVNLVLMHFRRSWVRREQVTEDGELPSRAIKGGREFNRTPVLDRIVLDEVIAKLPRGYRTVFILHDVEGLEHTEIAQVLGCSVGTSKSQLHKARMKLRDLLKRQNHAGSTSASIRSKSREGYEPPQHQLMFAVK